MAFDFGYFLKMIGRIGPKIPYTILIVVVSGALGILLAMGIAAIRIRDARSRLQGATKRPGLYPRGFLPRLGAAAWKLLYVVTDLFLSFFRSTPGIIHIFLIYYGLPLLLRQVGIDADGWSRTLYALIALILFNGAYLSEFLRPAYLSVSRGQHDAADSIGMGGFAKFYRIILPQMLPVAWPNLENAAVELVKDTSVLFVIGLVDIMGKAKAVISNDYGVKKLEVYCAAAVIYWCITFLVSKGFQWTGKTLGIAKQLEK